MWNPWTLVEAPFTNHEIGMSPLTLQDCVYCTPVQPAQNNAGASPLLPLLQQGFRHQEHHCGDGVTAVMRNFEAVCPEIARLAAPLESATESCREGQLPVTACWPA